MLALVISTTSFLPTHGTSAGQPCFSPSRSSCAVVACADKLRAKVSAPRKVPHPVLAAVDKHCRRVPAPHLPHRSEACARCGSRARRRRSESYSGSTSPAVRLHQAFRPAFHLCPNGWCCSAPSGECRGRKLRTPDVFLRPMMSRVREVRARLGGGVRLGAHLLHCSCLCAGSLPAGSLLDALSVGRRSKLGGGPGPLRRCVPSLPASLC